MLLPIKSQPRGYVSNLEAKMNESALCEKMMSGSFSVISLDLCGILNLDWERLSVTSASRGKWK